MSISAPLAKLAGRVAKLQLDGSRHVVAEHPQGSAVWDLQEWVSRTVPRSYDVDQCMAGLTGLRSGLLVKKPTEFWASDARLVRRLEPLRCDKSHDHAQLDGRTPGIPCDKAKDVAR